MVRHKQNKVTAQALRLLGLTLFLTVWLPSVSSSAATLYVSDTTVEANLRTGVQRENRIIALLRPGTQLTLVQEEDGWAKVTLADGRTGWILKRYLSERPPWRVTAQKLATENEQLRAQVANIKGGHQDLLQKNKELQKQMDLQQRELRKVRRDYEELKNSSTNYLNLKMAYENLQKGTRQSNAKLDKLEKAYGKLKTSTGIRWFLSGAGILLLGWILGSSVARLRRRRSSDYYKL
ncbi:MAG: TIGR04211 family SH3 domain-containing protein [Syntrophobacteria bacterium]